MKRSIRKVGKLLKRKLYFVAASYFAFFAKIYLRKWNPKVITVTGSSGKTTLLHLFEAQLGSTARYSHHANSAFGIPFHILGFERKTYRSYEWFVFAFLAPFRAFRRTYSERLYVTEADAERPGEGKFLARLLRPDILVWLSLDEAHGAQYDASVRAKASRTAVPTAGTDQLNGVKKAMAEEFGWFLPYTRSCAILNRSNSYIEHEALRTKAEILWLDAAAVTVSKIARNAVSFASNAETLSVPGLVPPDAGLSAFATVRAVRKLGLPVDTEFKSFILPPGRSSVFAGIRNTTLIDSTYNATMGGMRTMLALFKSYPASGEKWLVLGDMIEQGESEAEEHESLAALVVAVMPSRVVLVGPRLARYTKPLLAQALGRVQVVSYDLPGEAYTYLMQEIKGGETILFKGARYLEGVVERLLLNPGDELKLCRRGTAWNIKRKAWGV